MFRCAALVLLLATATPTAWAQAPTASPGLPSSRPPGLQPAVPPPPAPLTLADAVREAVAASPSVHAQQARAEGERRAAPLSGRLPNPTLAWLGEGLRANPPTVLQPDHGVSVTQGLPLGGRLGKQRRVAEASADVAARDVDELRDAVALETIDLFIEAMRAGGLLEVTTRQRDGLDALVRIQQRRVDEGVGTTGDLGRLQAEWTRVEVAVTRHALDARRARLALCVTLGRATCDDWTPVLPEATWLASPAGTGALSVGTADLSAAVERHPQVRAALARQEEARLARVLADASVWPTLDVTTGYKRTQFLDTAMAGLSVTLPIFDRHQVTRVRAAAVADAATLEVDLARRLARLAIGQAVAQATALVDEVQRLDGLTPALDAQRAARSAYREGAADLVRLLDAERLVADADADRLHLSLDATQALARARVLLGLPLP